MPAISCAVAPGLAVGLVDRGDDRAADVDVGGDVVARIADESGCRDRRRQAAVADLPREGLHLRRGRGDVDRRDVARRVRVGAQTRNGRTPRLALVLERLAAEDAAHDRHRVPHRPERLRRLRADVVQEDLRRPEAEEEAARACGLLHHSCIHRNLHRVTGERRDDSPPDRETLRLLRHERGHDRRRARLHAVLAPPGVRLGEPDRVHPGLVHDARRLEHLVEWLHGELHDADPKR
jgi:hypothetical protein